MTWWWDYYSQNTGWVFFINDKYYYSQNNNLCRVFEFGSFLFNLAELQLSGVVSSFYSHGNDAVSHVDDDSTHDDDCRLKNVHHHPFPHQALKPDHDSKDNICPPGKQTTFLNRLPRTWIFCPSLAQKKEDFLEEIKGIIWGLSLKFINWKKSESEFSWDGDRAPLFHAS